MGSLTFEVPALLGLAALMPFLPILLRSVFPDRTRGMLALHLFVALVASAVLCAASGPGIETHQLKPAVAVFAVDASESVPPAERRRAFETILPIARDLENHGITVRALFFDSDVRWIDLHGEDRKNVEHGNPVNTRCGMARTSRIVPVLLETLGAVPPDGRGRIYIFSDGRFSDGPDAEILPRRLPLYTFPLDPEGIIDVSISSLSFVPPLEEGTPTAATVEIQSIGVGRGTVSLHRGNASVADREVILDGRGSCRVVFTDLRLPRGTHRFSARFKSLSDNLPDAEPVFVDLHVEGPPRIYFVDGTPPRGVALLRALEVQEIDLTAGLWERDPAPESFEEFDAFVLVAPPDMVAEDDFTGRLSRYVAGGGGLVLVADETGFGPAFRRTPLASAVPVIPPDPALKPPPPDEDPQGKTDPETEPPPPPPDPDPGPDEPQEEPPMEPRTVEVGSIALVFLIDKSGSMAGKKVRLAKEAAIAAAEEIGPENSIGVLAFDTEATWLVPLSSARNVGWVIDRVSRLQAGGGTNIFPALVKSYNALEQAPARIKHVILISDGYNKTQEEFKEIVTKMAEAGITLSTIGVGDQFDTRLLSQLTYWAGKDRGRFDFTFDVSRIPRLVLRQTRWALGKSEDPESGPTEESPPSEPPPPDAVEPPEEPPPEPPPPREDPPKPERLPIRLVLPHPSPPFRGIEASDVPPVYGVRKTIARPLGDVLAMTPDRIPVIVLGEHGLGKILYVGTAFTGEWGSDWAAWEDFPKWVGQALRWVKRRPERPLPPRVKFRLGRDGVLEATILADPAAVAPEAPPQLLVKRENEEDRILPVLRAGTRTFSSRIGSEMLRPGTTLRVEFPPGSGSVPLVAEVAIPVAVPFERAFTVPDLQGLERLARSSGGRFAPSIVAASGFLPARGLVVKPLWWAPSSVALALLPVIALLRRRKPVSH